MSHPFTGVRGYRIGAIHWVTPEWGYQTFTIPAKKFTGNDDRVVARMPLTHTKVWHLPPGGERVAVTRRDTVAAAKAYIKGKVGDTPRPRKQPPKEGTQLCLSL